MSAKVVKEKAERKGGLLKWKDVVRVMAWLKARSEIDMPDAAIVPVPTGLKLYPRAGAGGLRPFEMAVDLDGTARIKPGFVLVGADWTVPMLGLTSLLEDNTFAEPPAYIWLAVETTAYIASATSLDEEEEPVEAWYWAGCRLVSAEVFGDSSPSHADEPGTIHETISGGNHNATCTAAATNYLLLAEWNTETESYDTANLGNQRILTTQPSSIGGGDWAYQPLLT